LSIFTQFGLASISQELWLVVTVKVVLTDSPADVALAPSALKTIAVAGGGGVTDNVESPSLLSFLQDVTNAIAAVSVMAENLTKLVFILKKI
jgi:hypothetical protein